MPRKTDGIEFEIHPRPTKGEDGKPLHEARLCNDSGVYDIQRTEARLCQSLSRQPLQGRTSASVEGTRKPPLALLS